MVEVKAVKRVTVTEQVMEQIAQLIISGQIGPGEKLPNEREFAELFQVTRGRVREALRALSLLGLITIKAGEGSFVNPREIPLSSEAITWMFHNELHNLDEVYAARKLIESEIYLTAARQINREHQAKLDQLFAAIEQAKDQGSPQIFVNALDEFDLYMGEMSGNSIYTKLMQTIVHLRRETSLKLLNVPGAIENSVKNRQALMQAIQSEKPELVRKAVNQFFTDSKKFYDRIIAKEKRP